MVKSSSSRALQLLGIFACAIGTAGASRASAQMLEVAPVTVDFMPGQMTRTLTVTNRSDHPTRVQLRAQSWDQQAGESVLGSTDRVLVSPPITQIAPGVSQTVRVVLRQAATTKEDSYRLLIDELPEPAAAGSVRVALRISLPVFVAPKIAVRPQLSWNVERTSVGKGFLRIRNDGTRHVRLTQMLLSGSASNPTVVDTPFVYVLPNSEVKVPIAWNGEFTSKALKVHATGDQGAVDSDAIVAPH